jgi:formate hydrogenlyase transcriptional activator
MEAKHRRWDGATRYQILLSINNAVINQTTKGEFFRALSEELHRHFSYGRLAINLYDKESQSLNYFCAADGISPEGISSMESRPLAKGTIARMAIQSGQPVVIDDLTRFGDLSSIGAMVNAGLTSTLAFPLIVRNKTLGTMHFSYKEPPPFISELIEILTDVSRQVAIAVDNMISHERLKERNINLYREKKFLLNDSEHYSPGQFYYASPAMQEIIDLVKRVADTEVSILITGETGTGKDYIARYVHNLSNRREHLFVKVNCPALPPTLFESELFGHSKGAFTGADTERVGRFEMAHQGTIFLDEVADMPANLQAKLLQVLQEGCFERVGDSRPVKVDFRVIAATNKNISDSIDEGVLRSDLYYRLNTVTIHLKPLRDRPEDVPVLMNNLTLAEARKVNREPPRYTAETLRFLSGYAWPGNVRQLKNLVKRLLILRSGETLNVDVIKKMLSGDSQKAPQMDDAVLTLAEAERQAIIKALKAARGAVGGKDGAATLLDLPRSTLQYRMKKLAIAPRDYK